jgi:hypothetical protein
MKKKKTYKKPKMKTEKLTMFSQTCRVNVHACPGATTLSGGGVCRKV